MLPACHRSTGQNIGFPDVCNTPVGTATVPIPYPNIADHSQATGFSTLVMISGLNALHTNTTIPTTSGDEAGTASSTKGKGAFTTGNLLVSIEKMPGITLTSPTTGNAGNNSVGAVLVPAATTVTYTRLLDGSSPDPADPYARELTVEAIVELGGAMDGTGDSAAVASKQLDEGVGYLRIPLFISETPTRVHRAMRSLDTSRGLVIDLRGNPGGDLDALVRLAEEFLPKGTTVLRYREGHGTERELVTRHAGNVELPLTLWVDGGTASAAELFAAALQHHGRACVVGERTHGKGSAQRLVVGADAIARYLRVGECRMPDGRSIAETGVIPDASLQS